MLRDPLTVVYDGLSGKIGSPKDLKKAMDSKETFETNPEAFEIPQQPQEKTDEEMPASPAKVV